jgi:hypothetical protein
MRAFDAAVLGQLPQGSAQAAAVVLWSCARLRHHPGEALFLAAADRQLAIQPGQLAPLSLALTAWAAGVLEVRGARGRLWALLEAHAQLVGSYGPSDASLVLWALARLRMMPPPGWLAAVFSHTQPQLAAFPPRELANLVWGLAQLPDYAPPAGWRGDLAGRWQAGDLTGRDRITVRRALQRWNKRRV